MSDASGHTAATAGTHSRAAGHTHTEAAPRLTPWVGWIWFGAVMMFLLGTFTAIYGLVALFQDDYYTLGPQGLLLLDLTAWGWIHLIVGAGTVVVALGLLTGAMWARIIAVILASLNALSQLVFMAVYPAWALIALALDVVVIWAVIVHGDELERRATRN